MSTVASMECRAEEFLIGRQYLYKFFWAIFGKEPTKELAEVVNWDTVLQSFNLFEESYAPGVSEATKNFFANSQEYLRDKEIDSLGWEYTQLCIGPGKPTAPPWESVYYSSDGLVKQRCMLEVRDEYAKQGFAPRNRPTALDDSLSLELDFMYRLAEKMFISKSERERKELGECSLLFLQNHLGTWVEPFRRNIEKSGFEFYRMVGAALASFIACDLAFLKDKVV